MAYQNIDKNSLKYLFLKRFAGFAFRHYYSNIEIANAQRIPKNQPVILPANHQNALMDALAIIFNTPFQPIFLARSDIFSSPLLVKILTTLKIMPIYRIRDGADKLKKNEEIFDKTVEVLTNKHNPLCIMPEGNHGDKRRLRPLVKGIFRIAFKAQEQFGKNNGVQIIPVGIDYGHYQNMHHHLFLNVGEPIQVGDYVEKYEENQAATVNELRTALSEELKKVMIHIESEDYYDTYMQLRIVYNKSMCNHLGIEPKSLSNRFSADKKMISILDNTASESELENLKELNSSYFNDLDKENLRDWVIAKKQHTLFEVLGKSILAIIGLPFYVLGLVAGYVPYKIPTLFVKKIKDPQFHSSVKYVLGMLLFVIYFLLLSILALIFVRPVWIALGIIALLYPLSRFAFGYYIFVKKLRAQWKYFIHKSKLQKLKDLRSRIIQMMDTIVLRHIE